MQHTDALVTDAHDMTTRRSPRSTARGWIPGELGIWAFILTDLAAFGAYFGTFVYERGEQPEAFHAGSEALDPTYGVLNTLFLLTASLFVALSVHHVRQGDGGSARRLMVAAGACGLAFMVNKPIEWAHEIDAGHTARDGNFFQLYYILTGFHLAHVIAAMIVLGFMWRTAGRVANRGPTRRQARFVENGACYWHLVDLIWIVLFALLYLAR